VQNKSGETPLGESLECSPEKDYESIQYDLVKLLLERGADPNLSADYIQTPIERVCDGRIERLMKKYDKK